MRAALILLALVACSNSERESAVQACKRAVASDLARGCHYVWLDDETPVRPEDTLGLCEQPPAPKVAGHRAMLYGTRCR